MNALDFLPAKQGEPSCLEMWLPIKTCIEVANTLLLAIDRKGKEALVTL